MPGLPKSRPVVRTSVIPSSREAARKQTLSILSKGHTGRHLMAIHFAKDMFTRYIKVMHDFSSVYHMILDEAFYAYRIWKYRLMFSYTRAPFLYELWTCISWHDFSIFLKCLFFNVQLSKPIRYVISVASSGFTKFVPCDIFNLYQSNFWIISHGTCIQNIKWETIVLNGVVAISIIHLYQSNLYFLSSYLNILIVNFKTTFTLIHTCPIPFSWQKITSVGMVTTKTC
jgi:hypothetical protein